MVAEHDPVARKRSERPIEHELGERPFARQQPFTVKQREMRRGAGCAQMQVNRRPVTKRPPLARQQADIGIDTAGRGVQRRVEDPLAALEPILLHPGAAKIERAELPCIGGLYRCAVGVDRTHPHGEPPG